MGVWIERMRDGSRTAGRMRPVGVALIVVFWAMHFVFVSLARAIHSPGAEDAAMLLPRTLIELAAIALSLAIMEAHIAFGGGGIGRRMLLTFLVALAVTGGHLLVHVAVFGALFGMEDAPPLPSYAIAIVNWLFIYVGISAILMALRYHAEVADRDLSLARLDALARDAELRALRYQLNPHFLFNALNSSVALIAHGQAGEAERMIENLSDFLRAGLALDAEDDIPLFREIELQRLYLDVEAVRFPDRLKVVVDVRDGLAQALVPSLLLQPLVENAIRYSVTDSLVPVTVTIEAMRARGRMRLVVRDDGEAGRAGTTSCGPGTGVGLANVAARLRARFGDTHHFMAGAARGVGFVVAMELPLRMADARA